MHGRSTAVHPALQTMRICQPLGKSSTSGTSRRHSSRKLPAVMPAILGSSNNFFAYLRDTCTASAHGGMFGAFERAAATERQEGADLVIAEHDGILFWRRHGQLPETVLRDSASSSAVSCVIGIAKHIPSHTGRKVLVQCQFWPGKMAAIELGHRHGQPCVKIVIRELLNHITQW